MNYVGIQAVPGPSASAMVSALALYQAYEAEARKTGATLSELAVLQAAVDLGEEAFLSRIADKLGCQRSNLTQVVDRLERKQLAAREWDAMRPSFYRLRVLGLGEAALKRWGESW